MFSTIKGFFNVLQTAALYDLTLPLTPRYNDRKIRSGGLLIREAMICL
jgi:hypothetical protein